MNVFLHEVRALRRSTIIWAVSLSALVAMFMIGMYPAFTQDVEAAKKLLEQLPELVRVAFSIQVGTFFTIYGFYAYFLSFAAVAGAVQAMNLGTGVIAKENALKTADFLMSKPITRPKIVTEKLAAALLAIVVTSATFSVVSYASAVIASSEPVKAGNFLLMTSTFFLVQLFFLALGALFAVLLPKVKSVISVTLPTVFAFYIVGTLGEVVKNLNVRYVSPFKFFDPLYMAGSGKIEGRYLGLELVLVVLAVAATYLIFSRKDVRAAA